VHIIMTRVLDQIVLTFSEFSFEVRVLDME